MKARGGRFLLILGAGLAAMAFVVVYLVMSKSSAPTVDPAASVPVTVPMRSIVVAKVPIPAYTTLDETNLGLLEVEASTVSGDAVTDPNLLYKKMSTTAIAAQKPVLASEVASVSFSTALAKNEKGFSLSVPARNTFADSITEGDHVDVLWSVDISVTVPLRAEDGKVKYEERPYRTSKTLLQDIRVARVVKLAPAQPPQTPAGGDGNGATDAQAAAQKTSSNSSQVVAPTLSSLYANENASYTTVLLLAVTDQQAEVLKYTRVTGGELDLTLRSSAPVKDKDGNITKDADGKEIRGDHEVEKTTGITIDVLIKSYGLVPPPDASGVAPTP